MKASDKLLLTGLVALSAGLILYLTALAGYPLVYLAFAALGVPL